MRRRRRLRVCRGLRGAPGVGVAESGARLVAPGEGAARFLLVDLAADLAPPAERGPGGNVGGPQHDQIGRAPCRERVGTYVEISGVAASITKRKHNLKNKKKIRTTAR